jgi:hypothetical protein
VPDARIRHAISKTFAEASQQLLFDAGFVGSFWSLAD